MNSTSLIELLDDELDLARSDGGRRVHPVHGAEGGPLRQILVTLAAGGELPEHDRPGEATLQVLRGRVRLCAAGRDAWEGCSGELLPDERHSVLALADSAILITIAG